ncbi:hypothetical protein HK098_005844 [Nowakowskiella sp. JEL0407]|nr:hypothetical protein HK098_005844 [Nowakowskiella sp. JEL0407]
MSSRNLVVDYLIKSYSNRRLPDDESDLDKYAADLLLKEATQKEKSYKRDGLSAYSSPSPAKMNMRFLNNVVQSTSNHNHALLEKTKANCNLKLEQLDRETRRRRYDSSESEDSDHHRKPRKKHRKEYPSETDDSDYNRKSKKKHRKRKSSRRQSRSRSKSPDLVIESKVERGGTYLYEEKYKSRGRTSDSVRPHKTRTPSRSVSVESDYRYRKSSSKSKRRTHSVTDEKKDVKETGIAEKARTGVDDDNTPELKYPQSTNSHKSDSASVPTTSKDRNGKPDILSIPKRGRGAIGSSQLDKYFEEGYDPKLDISNYDESNIHWYVHSLQTEADAALLETMKKKKKKERHHKKKKDRKRRASSESESEDDKMFGPRVKSSEEMQPRPTVCPW